MIAIGIPSFNEADNIGQLVQAIDRAALTLHEPIVIINADNNSEDATADVFRATCTTNKKVALTTTKKGKGRNIQCIIKYVVENEIRYCFFVDGDVTSMDPEWIIKHIAEANRGIDYVVPNYSRKMQEGNATNHFFFPVLSYFSKGRSPYQPIAGDVGISLRLARHLTKLSWSQPMLGYGVDIFMTMTALFNGYKVVEISLERKLHKPSYGKMINIFEEAAASYFEVREGITDYSTVHFTKEEDKLPVLLAGEPIPVEEVEKRTKFAKMLLANSGSNSSYAIGAFGLDAETWAQALVEHEKQIGINDGLSIARSLTPFYLLRVTDYLRKTINPIQAQQALDHQRAVIAKYYAKAGL